MIPVQSVPIAVAAMPGHASPAEHATGVEPGHPVSLDPGTGGSALAGDAFQGRRPAGVTAGAGMPTSIPPGADRPTWRHRRAEDDILRVEDHWGNGCAHHGRTRCPAGHRCAHAGSATGIGDRGTGARPRHARTGTGAGLPDRGHGRWAAPAPGPFGCPTDGGRNAAVTGISAPWPAMPGIACMSPRRTDRRLVLLSCRAMVRRGGFSPKQGMLRSHIRTGTSRPTRRAPSGRCRSDANTVGTLHHAQQADTPVLSRAFIGERPTQDQAPVPVASAAGGADARAMPGEVAHDKGALVGGTAQQGRAARRMGARSAGRRGRDHRTVRRRDADPRRHAANRRTRAGCRKCRLRRAFSGAGAGTKGRYPPGDGPARQRPVDRSGPDCGDARKCPRRRSCRHRQKVMPSSAPLLRGTGHAMDPELTRQAPAQVPAGPAPS